MDEPRKHSGESDIPNIILKTGDRLFIDLQEKTGSSGIRRAGHLFEDNMLIANKPAGMPTHPNEEGQTGTLSNLIAYHFQINGEQAKVRHVHRLDRDTPVVSRNTAWPMQSLTVSSKPKH